MRNLWKISVGLVVAVAGLIAADPAWRTKPSAQWTPEDARQILAASPWSKEVKAVVTRRLTEEELREGGQMGQPTGVGHDGVDPQGSGPKVSLNVFTGDGGDDRSLRSRNQPLTLRLRWESALPIRIAEFTSPGAEAPALEGEGYRIAVFGIPGGGFKGDPKELGKPLKNLAALKREGKKDVKPVSAAVYQTPNGVVVEYLFPMSAEIDKKDGQVQFLAQIGRIVVNQSFLLSDMEFLGKLEL